MVDVFEVFVEVEVVDDVLVVRVDVVDAVVVDDDVVVVDIPAGAWQPPIQQVL